MAYNPPTDTELAPEKPGLSSVFIRLRDALTELVSGAAGAPRIQTGAYGAGSIDQAAMGASSVGQVEIKTTTAAGTTSVGGGASGSYSLVGGTYSMWTMGATDGATRNLMFGNSDTAAGTIGLYNNGGSTSTVYVDERYFQASPPYNHGPLFVYAVMNSDKTIDSLSVAPDPIWAYHGPTNIGTQRYDAVADKRYRTEKTIDGILFNDAIKDDVIRGEYLNGNISAVEEEIEITLDYKDKDMNIIPHPWTGNNLNGKAVVMMEPGSLLMQKLFDVLEEGGAKEAFSIINDGYINIDNSPIVVPKTPDALSIVKANWKPKKG